MYYENRLHDNLKVLILFLFYSGPKKNTPQV